MATAALVDIDQYLQTSYEPDCDYVDGALEERNLGTRPHSGLQSLFSYLLFKYYAEALGIFVYTEQRVQTRPTRFRVPDICVTLNFPEEDIFRTAPFLCVEILSPEDRLPRVELRVQEFLNMGVAFVWLIDPLTREAWVYSQSSKLTVTDGFLRTADPDLQISLQELFHLAERR